MSFNEPQPVAFRRLFLDHGCVCCETEPGRMWYLPNGERGYAAYRPRVMFDRIRERGTVALELWKPLRGVDDG